MSVENKRNRLRADRAQRIAEKRAKRKANHSQGSTGGVQGADPRNNGGGPSGLDRLYAMNPHMKAGGSYNQKEAEAQSKHRNDMRKDARQRHVAEVQGKHSEEAALARKTGGSITPDGAKTKGEASWEAGVAATDASNAARGLQVGQSDHVDKVRGGLGDTGGSAMTGGGSGATGSGLMSPPTKAKAGGSSVLPKSTTKGKGLDPSLGKFELGQKLKKKNLFDSPY